MKKNILTAVMLIMAGNAYAMDFTGLQAFKASDLRLTELAKIQVPATPAPTGYAQKGSAEFRDAVLRISDYTKKERTGKFLNNKELADLAKQLNYIVGLTGSNIPTELLGYLEGLSAAIRTLLPKGPVGRETGPALDAAAALQNKMQVGIQVWQNGHAGAQYPF